MTKCKHFHLGILRKPTNPFCHSCHGTVCWMWCLEQRQPLTLWGPASHLGSSPYHKKYCWRSMSLFFKKMPQCNESVTLLFSCYFVTLLLHYFSCRRQERARKETEFHLSIGQRLAETSVHSVIFIWHTLCCILRYWGSEWHLYIHNGDLNFLS